MSDSPETTRSPRGVARRSVLKAGAWSVPVVAVAVAAPAVSASTTANLALLPPQFGSGVPLFTPALTERYVASEPVGVVVGNTTGQVYTGPVILRLEVDRRLWDVTGFTYDARDGEGARSAGFSGPSVTGDRAVYTATFAATVVPNADPYTGILVRPDLTFLGDYPDDTLEPADSVSTWTLVEAADLDASDNVHVNGPGATEESSPFGATVTADFAQVTSGSGSAYRPTQATLTSVGPNPTAVGDTVRVTFDAALGDLASLEGVALNGTPAPDLVSEQSNTVSGAFRSVLFSLTSPLASGDVVTFALSYSDPTGATPQVGSSPQIGYSAAVPNDPDQRALSRSYVNGPQS
ncbi:hypothetical protein [Microbacterium sp. IEGM 1404]|uniref:hypothetical protein n=1 Tax=Microbacterium sp. IEGM 1404 TaxID=3047084 RepID=UPI0024B7327A|nr:hypothetical protein [Microbacterium sp. IEGM 1404]MDI9891434.1 hypothetical protein [Microbacterium sp. IEGM 1404]